MTVHLPDASVLINCLREQAPGHRACRIWLESVLAGNEPLFLSELVEVALLRITTRLGIAGMDIALGFWDDLTSYPHACRITPGPTHGKILRQLILGNNLSGNDVNDAWLAACAIEHDATLITADEGFSRFSKLKWFNPLSL